MSSHFKIIVPFYNVEEWIKVCIRSIKLQNYQSFQCILVDDLSTDKSAEIVEQEIAGDYRFVLVRNTEKAYALKNIYDAINLSNPYKEDIIVTLDGDDWLANKNVLNKLNNMYIQDDCWLTYGSYAEYPGAVRGKFAKQIPSHVIQDNLYRNSEWCSSHLRTFKYHLWSKIKKEDLLDSSGNFYRMAWDLAFMFPMLEMAGERSRYVKDILYVYNLGNPLNDHKVDARLQQNLEAEIRGKEKYNRISIDPSNLLTPLRFDIAAKIIYAKSLLRADKSIFPKEIYLQHLKVWNNFHEKVPLKKGEKSFLDSFYETFTSIQNNGFKRAEAIPAFNGSPVNGAHRVASCITLQKTPTVRKASLAEGQRYCNYEYFRDRRDFVKEGLGEVYLDEMALEYCRNKKNLFTVTLFPSHDISMGRLVGEIRKDYNIIYSKEITLSKLGKNNYIHNLYYGEPWIGSKDRGYPGVLEKSSYCFSKGDTIKVLLIEENDIENILSLKGCLRHICGVGKHSVHINDTQEETWRIASSVFNENSIHMLNNRVCNRTPKFDLFLGQYHKFLEKRKDWGDYCVDSSAVLSAYGVRDCRDLDFLHLDGVPSFTEEIECHNDWAHHYAVPKNDIIYDPRHHFYLYGVKFASLNVVLDMKHQRAETKDLEDIHKTEKLISSNNKNIVILAGGPPKLGRNRHLEIYGGQPLISKLLSQCKIGNARTYVVLDKSNEELKRYLRKEHPNIALLFPDDTKIMSTFKEALSVKGDCIMVCGDLINVGKADIERFMVSDFKSATCHYTLPWGTHIKSVSGDMLRRADVGDCISMIAETDKHEFLSRENAGRAQELFTSFYPAGNQHDGMNEYWYNDVGTFTSFAFFEDLWSVPGCNRSSDRGLITFRHKIYEDND